MKFSQIAKGIAAERPSEYSVGKDEKGKDLTVHVLLRPLSALEEVEVESTAIKFAKGRGAEAEAGSPIFEEAQMASILAASVMDPDSPGNARERHFDGGLDQILSCLDPDTIAFLHAEQRLWQEECSPSYKVKTASDLLHLMRLMGVESEDEDDPKVRLLYSRLSRATQWSLVRTMAVLLRSSRVLKPSSSYDSDPSIENDKSDSPVVSPRPRTGPPSSQTATVPMIPVSSE